LLQAATRCLAAADYVGTQGLHTLFNDRAQFYYLLRATLM
jgi:hypothetical protein